VQRVTGFFSEADAVIADPKPHIAGIALEFLDVAFACFSKSVESRQDAHSLIAVDTTNIGTGRRSKDDLLHSGSLQRRSSVERPNSARISSWGMPWPGCSAIHAFDAATALRSCSVSSSSSMGAFAIARDTGSSIVSISPIMAETWLGASRSISLCACCFGLVTVETIAFVFTLKCAASRFPSYRGRSDLIASGNRSSSSRARSAAMPPR